MNKIPLHIKCENKDDIADIVLMPGDPLRAKYIAEKFLKDFKLVTSVRNMLGFTGYYKDRKVTVMGSGMGMPSMSIYAFELFHFFDVKKIIRVGTCGVNDPNINIPDIILADLAYSETNFDYTYESIHHGVLYPDKELNNDIIESAKKLNLHINVGSIITCDAFGPYANMKKVYERAPKDIKIIGEEMEAYALFLISQKLNRKAACLLTCVDSPFSSKILSIEDRERSLDKMIMLALDAIIK
ncbi:MAG: purine-nucleoside phosphorylase [Mollicutes bacterium]|nr:purine-nucleoside phosphorylase [Mollicutes bacterium]